MLLRNFEAKVFFALVLLTSAIFFWMVRGFVMPIFWAAVLAILFQPVFLRMEGFLKGRRSTAALLTTLVVVLVVLIPFALIVAAMAAQALTLYRQIASGQIDVNAPLAFMERSLPRLTAVLNDFGIETARVREGIEVAAVATTQWIAAQALLVGQNILTTSILFILMLYFLFFLFRDGDKLLHGLIRALPMGDEREAKLFSKFAQVSRATVKGTLIVAAVQGAIGGVLFVIVGIQAAVFWGVIMAILSLLPAVGPALVWGPAAIIQFSTGGIWQGILLVLGGAIVVGLSDNLLRPLLVGRETKMPDYLILLSTLGGLTMFGLAGFVVGPIIASLFLVMWQMFADEYSPLDSSEPPAIATAIPDEARMSPEEAMERADPESDV
jgi:predicted PurR-regulated permease PerM